MLGSLAFLKPPAPSAAQAAPPAAVDFNRDIRPILSDHCFACHGQDAARRKAHLRVDQKSNVFGTLDSGSRGIVPGHPEESEIYCRMTASERAGRMPPRSHAKPLSPEQIELVRRWIVQGADWKTHWAFEGPQRPPVPAVKNSSWPRNAIDAFVLARQEREGVEPAPEVDRAMLLRRVSLDLTGLPPTLAEVDAFLADGSPDAYERQVDRLLQSPRYGERMAQAWLDWARFADSGGQNYDRPRTMWPWRDWVIRAFNANLAFDRFTIEQLAGDLLPEPSPEQRLATGFHRNAIMDNDGNNATDFEENRAFLVTDMVNTTATVWLGLTLGCAQCHDHKYDPITQADYYRFGAYFNKQSDNLAQMRPRDPFGNIPPTVEVTYQDGPTRKTVSAMVMRDDVPQRETFVLLRGDFRQKGPKVRPGVPAFLNTPLPAEHGQDRLGLARWLVDPRHPLTSRVIVNRLWEQLFGAGLVRTSEDFGNQGEPSTHPELLDWLAQEFIAGGWDVKAMLKVMVTSATYRQSSILNPSLLARDPQNRLLAHYSRTRLSGEFIRDNALAVSGLLDQRIGGPPAFPPIPASHLELYMQVRGGDTRQVYTQSTGRDLCRRSIYVLYKRSLVYPPFAVFDAPTRETCTVRRGRSNTPLQALVLLNEPGYLMAALGLAGTALTDGMLSDNDRLQMAFRRCTGRPPSSAELEILQESLQEQRQHFAGRPDAARQLVAAVGGPAAEPDPTNLAAWILVGNLLLNLDETMTKE
jgi:hypothetical protein